MSKFKRNKGGYLLVQVLVFGAVAVVVITGLVAFAVINTKLSRRVILSEQAFQMAEAGLEYYRWHLAHDPLDFTDGTGQPGPYVKDFYNNSGQLLGTITLDIIAPSLGSTLVTLESTGTSVIDPTVRRTILSRLAIPSFANFAAVTHAANRFGAGTEVFGPIHSNNGVRFDGLAHNIVTSSVSSYNDPDHSGNNEFGVHTHVDPPPGSGVDNSFQSAEAPPNTVPSRPDVFIAGRSFPTPVVNFNAISTDLTYMQTEAENNGGLYFADSNDDGYLVVLKVDDTLDLYIVNNLQSPPNGCSSSGQSGWGTWSVGSTTFEGNYPFPANGLIFFGDNIWVEGAIDVARITIVAANIPDNDPNDRKSITINDNISYTNYDGTDAIALIAQNNLNVGMTSDDDLRIDGALVAQNGRVGRYYYEDDCDPYHDRDTITLYGTMISSQRYGFSYTDGTGYDNRNLIYDAAFLFTPPPYFPQTEDFHEVIFWKEIK